MPEPIFKRVVGDDGKETFVEVKEATELPEELVKATPMYKQVLDESIKRRQIIQSLKKPVVVTNEDDTEVVADAPKEEKPIVATPAAVDEDALFQKFETRLTAKQQAEKEAREKRETEITTALSANGLPEKMRAALETSTNPNETAKIIAQAGYRFDDVEAGEVPTIKSKPVDEAVQNFMKKYKS